MNERILELAEQAGSTHKQNLGVYQFYTHELEKFAESIVRECAGLVEDYYDEDTKYLAGHIIRKHFGVK
jgi:hypothetical protein